MTNPHPNATAAGFGGALGVLAVWGLGLAGLDIEPEVAAAVSTVVASVALFVGRFGPFKQ